MASTENNVGESTGLIRGVGLAGAVRLNVLDMIGVGPFITLPLIIIAMHGPQAMLGWILGAVLAMCDGLVWAELGASFPTAGGSYEYLKQAYGPSGLGRMVSFLFIWQLTFSAPLSIASGCIGLASYAGYLWPGLRAVLWQHHMSLALPLLGSLEADILITPGTWVAMGCCLLAVVLLYRRITSIGQLTKWLAGGVLLTVAWVIWAGISHFNVGRAFDFPAGAFDPSTQFFTGLGAALLIATVRLLGLLQHLFSRRGSEAAPAHDSARDHYFHFAGGGDLSADEYQRAGRDSVARTRGADQRRGALVGDFRFSCSSSTADGQGSW